MAIYHINRNIIKTKMWGFKNLAFFFEKMQQYKALYFNMVQSNISVPAHIA